jgi:hypothetical protein
MGKRGYSIIYEMRRKKKWEGGRYCNTEYSENIKKKLKMTSYSRRFCRAACGTYYVVVALDFITLSP